MTRANPSADPSMEDILASIRRIISEDAADVRQDVERAKVAPRGPGSEDEVRNSALGLKPSGPGRPDPDRDAWSVASASAESVPVLQPSTDSSERARASRRSPTPEQATDAAQAFDVSSIKSSAADGADGSPERPPFRFEVERQGLGRQPPVAQQPVTLRGPSSEPELTSQMSEPEYAPIPSSARPQPSLPGVPRPPEAESVRPLSDLLGGHTSLVSTAPAAGDEAAAVPRPPLEAAPSPRGDVFPAADAEGVAIPELSALERLRRSAAVGFAKPAPAPSPSVKSAPTSSSDAAPWFSGAVGKQRDRADRQPVIAEFDAPRGTMEINPAVPSPGVQGGEIVVDWTDAAFEPAESDTISPQNYDEGDAFADASGGAQAATMSGPDLWPEGPQPEREAGPTETRIDGLANDAEASSSGQDLADTRPGDSGAGLGVYAAARLSAEPHTPGLFDMLEARGSAAARGPAATRNEAAPSPSVRPVPVGSNPASAAIDRAEPSSTPAGSLAASAGAAQVSRSAAATPSAVPPMRDGETSLEGMVASLLRPMLREWLDDNLPRVVEKMLADELRDRARTHRAEDDQR